MAVTTSAGYSIIDYSDDTNLTEVDTGGNSDKAERGVAYNATGSKVFFSGGSSTLYRYDGSEWHFTTKLQAGLWEVVSI